MKMYFRSGCFKNIYPNLVLCQYISIYHKFNVSHGSLLRLLWCKLKWQIPLENTATVLPHPPNPQQLLQPGSQWVLTPSSRALLWTQSSCSSVWDQQLSNQSCLMGMNNWGKRSTGQHQIISACNFTFLLVLTGLCQGKLWLSLLLSLQITSLTETFSSFHAGNNLLLMCEKRAKSYFLGEADSTELS